MRPGRRRWVRGGGRAGPLWNSLLLPLARPSEGATTSCDRRALRARARYRGRELSRFPSPARSPALPSLTRRAASRPALKHANGHRYVTVAPERWAIVTFGTRRVFGWRALAGGSHSEFGLPAEGYPKKHGLPRRARWSDNRTSRAFQLPLLCRSYWVPSMGGRLRGRSSGESWFRPARARGRQELDNHHRHPPARVRPVIEFETGRW